MPSLTGKRILVTGGSRGLGAEISKQLASRGAVIAVNYASSKDRAEQTVAGLNGTGHAIVHGDAFSHAGIDSIFKDAKAALGGIDAVVSNHGWTKFGAFNDLSGWGCSRLTQTHSPTTTGCRRTRPTSSATCGSCRPHRTSSRRTRGGL